MSTFSPNKSLELPAAGSYVNAWNVPINSDLSLLDTCLGGLTSISVTGVSSSITLSTTQYQPPNIEINGTLSQSLTVSVPAGVGGFWSVFNNTSGAYTLGFYTTGGAGVVIPQGDRAFLISDGTNMQVAQTLTLPFSALIGTIEPGQVGSTAVTQWQNILGIDVGQLVGAVLASQIGPLPASQTTSGVFAAARIPPPASLPGVYIVPDTGQSPTGGYGDIFYLY
jgi:hypothetical protein